MKERLTVKAAVYILVAKDNKILFIRRVNTGWRDGFFTLPAGHIEKGELPIDTALRELKEEVNLEAQKKDLEFIHVLYERDAYVDFYYKYNLKSGIPKVNGIRSADTFEWIALKEIEQYKIIPKLKLALADMLASKLITYSDTDSGN